MAPAHEDRRSLMSICPVYDGPLGPGMGSECRTPGECRERCQRLNTEPPPKWMTVISCTHCQMSRHYVMMRRGITEKDEACCSWVEF